jgi:hypothetical protein
MPASSSALKEGGKWRPVDGGENRKQELLKKKNKETKKKNK